MTHANTAPTVQYRTVYWEDIKEALQPLFPGHDLDIMIQMRIRLGEVSVQQGYPGVPVVDTIRYRLAHRPEQP